jgi:hypothetical protein
LAYVATGAFAHSGFSVVTGQMAIPRLIPIGIGIIAAVAASLYLRRLLLRTMVQSEPQALSAA